MTAAAIVMMVLAMVTLWGGLGVAIAHLMKHPDE